MIKDYIYGPVLPPYICFDGRFAKKYGITEAIIFNCLYHDYITTFKSERYGGRHSEDGWMEEAGQMWKRYSSLGLFGCLSEVFDAAQHRTAIAHLCSEGLLSVRPSLTDGYYWISIGEEPEGQ